MKDRITHLANGMIEETAPEISIEPERIDETVPAGIRLHCSIVLKTLNQIPIRGLIYVSGKHVRLIDRQMAGYRCEVEYEVAADEAKPGTVLEGRFSFVTNGAEFMIPYRYAIGEAPAAAEQAKDEIPDAPVPEKDAEAEMVKAEETAKEKYSLSDHVIELLADYLCGRFDARMILPSIDTELRIWKKNDPGSLWPDMLNAYLLLQRNRKNDAVHILEGIYDEVLARRSGEIEAYSFYLYLRFLLTNEEDQKETIYKLIVRFYREWCRTPILYLLILSMNEGWEEDPEPVLSEIRELSGQQTCVSLLRVEACRLLEKCPDQIGKLTSYEVGLFAYGLQQKLITKEMALRIGTSAAGTAPHDDAAWNFFRALYEAYPSKETLTALCCTAVRGHRASADMLPVYDKAIHEEILANGLYELYLDSLPEDYDRKLPEELLLYFSFRHELTDGQHEILYHHILKEYGTGTKVYKAYQEQMEQFTIRQLLAGRISTHLVPIYKAMLHAEMIDQRIGSLMPDVVFSKEVICDNPLMRRVVVKYPERVQEYTKVLTDGRVCVPVYTDTAQILFADARGRVYRAPYRMIPLMDDKEILSRCEEAAGDADAFRFLHCLAAVKQVPARKEDWELLYAASRDVAYEETFRRQIVSRLLESAEVFEETPGYDRFLAEVDIAAQPKKDLVLYEDILIRREKYDMAIATVHQFGYTGLKSERLEQLVREMIARSGDRENADILSIGMSLYRRKKADAQLLTYICNYYNGTTAEMFSILKDSAAVKADMGDLPERLLAQMMFTGDFKDMDLVFVSYLGSDNVLKLLVQAYYAVKCWQYFVREEEIAGYLFPYIEDFVKEGQCREEARLLCSAALIKYYSTLKELTEEQKELAASLIAEMLEQKRYFACFLKLTGSIALPAWFNGRYLIEYHGAKGRNIQVRYTFAPGEEDTESSRMTEMLDGVYVKNLTIFAGEWITCEVTEIDEQGETVLAPERIIRPDFAYRIPGSRFDRICSLEERGTTQEKKQQILQEMEKKDRMIDWLFPVR